MILEKPILPFGEWLLANLPGLLVVIAAVLATALFVGYLASALRHGPLTAFARTFRAVVTGWRELRQTSARRIFALGRLAFQESIRSKVLIAFVLFIVFLLFAGWFLDVESDTPARLYLSFVLTTTSYLVILLAMFLSSFSLPGDLKQRTIYTVVTKPVRAWEIVLGRLIGFAAIGTLLIVLMWACSFVFVVGGLRHSHDVDADTVGPVEGRAASNAVQGTTTLDSHHRHSFVIEGEEVGRTDSRRNHRHEVTRVGSGDELRVGPPREMLQAKVPVRGRLRFLDESGNVGEGVSVGYEWRYRDYIAGGTAAAAIWRFEGITQREFPRGLPMELTIRVFRTYIGDIERGIKGTIVLRNPATQLESLPKDFEAHDYGPDAIFISRERKSRDGRDIDLHDDLVHEGAVEVIVQCLEPAQYFGMAPADLYLRAGNNWFWLNFAKGYFAIWMQMMLVVAFGVMFSTFLSGAVAMLATLASIVTGFFAQFIVDVATGEAEGGGPIEAMIRTLKQMNLVTPLDESPSTTVVQGVDSVVLYGMRAVAYVLPDYGGFSATRFVAYGFDVPAGLVAQQIAVVLAYVVVLTCAGYFLLRSREIAA